VDDVLYKCNNWTLPGLRYFDKREREVDEKHFNKILTILHFAKVVQKGYFWKNQRLMKNSTIIGLAALAAMLASGCFAPQAVLRLEPLPDESIRWYQGQANAEKTDGGIKARAGFYNYDRDHLFFDIEIINNTSADVEVRPELFTMEHEGRVLARALDPDRQLLSSEMRLSRKEANAKNLAVAVGVATVATAVAVVATGDVGSASNVGDAGVRLGNSLNTANAAVDFALTGLYLADAVAATAAPPPPPAPEDLPPADHPAFWADYTLRRTTLGPGEQVRGLVVFPRMDEQPDFSLRLLIEGIAAPTVGFRQRVYRP
jgi:hypothetical protein